MPSRMAQLNDMAKKYINANYTPHFHDDSEIAVNVEVSTDGTVGVEGYHDFPTAIMRIVGINEIDLGADAKVKKSAGLAENIEVILVMDTTGSMDIDNKMDDAKDAAKLLLKEVLGTKTSDEHLKFALVPFSGSVNVGPTFPTAGVIDTTGVATVSKLNFTLRDLPQLEGLERAQEERDDALAWNGCVEARLGAYATDDTAPTVGTPNTLFTPYFAPDESSKGPSAIPTTISEIPGRPPTN